MTNRRAERMHLFMRIHQQHSCRLHGLPCWPLPCGHQQGKEYGSETARGAALNMAADRLGHHRFESTPRNPGAQVAMSCKARSTAICPQVYMGTHTTSTSNPVQTLQACTSSYVTASARFMSSPWFALLATASWPPTGQGIWKRNSTRSCTQHGC